MEINDEKDNIQEDELSDNEQTIPEKDNDQSENDSDVEEDNDEEDNDENDNPKEYDIRAVVGLDFGTTYSGFTYCSALDEESFRTYTWHKNKGPFKTKTNTVLQYDDEYNNVKSWGEPALAKKQSRRTNKQDCNEGSKPVELFKLHLSDLSDELKPKLPAGFDYKKAVTDYFKEIGKVIKEDVALRWPSIDFFEQVLLVITVPAEFPEKSKAIMRRCAFNAELTIREHSPNLQFTTEPEAAAVYCMKNELKEQNLAQPGINFMIVDCGGGTVDLTTRKLLNDMQLGEITERTGDFCGSTFVDAEFIKYLRGILGDEPMDLLRDNKYGQMQYLIQEFCNHVKIPFSGDPDVSYEFDIRCAPILKQEYITDENIKKQLDDDDWIIDINFETMKSLFEPVVQRILRLIKVQLDNAQETCSAMFLVGGFSESKYLQNRIKQEFNNRVNNISVPIQPIIAITHGAAIYGLSIKSKDLNNIDNVKCVISSRVLKYSYGIIYYTKWKEGDPKHKKDYSGHIEKFHCLARRGTKMDIDQKIETYCAPLTHYQTCLINEIYYTREYEGEYSDDPGMKLLGKFYTDLPGHGTDRNVSLGITFGKMEIVATAKNMQTGQSYTTTFKFNFDD